MQDGAARAGLIAPRAYMLKKHFNCIFACPCLAGASFQCGARGAVPGWQWRGAGSLLHRAAPAGREGGSGSDSAASINQPPERVGACAPDGNRPRRSDAIRLQPRAPAGIVIPDRRLAPRHAPSANLGLLLHSHAPSRGQRFVWFTCGVGASDLQPDTSEQGLPPRGAPCAQEAS